MDLEDLVESKRLMKKAEMWLFPQELMILKLRLEGATLTEIGRVIRGSRERARYLVHEAIRTIRMNLENPTIQDVTLSEVLAKQKLSWHYLNPNTGRRERYRGRRANPGPQWVYRRVRACTRTERGRKPKNHRYVVLGRFSSYRVWDAYHNKRCLNLAYAY